jgi:glucose-1-phosphate adenylyltransferase
MKRMMGVINLVNEPDSLEELTYHRNVASVPFGGRYRLIDFALSNMVNSGIRDVAIFTHHKHRSLDDHLGAGKEWDLDRKHGGLFQLPAIMDDPHGMMKGDLFQFFCHRDFFHRGSQEYVVISRSHVICNMDFAPVLRFHLETEADITVVYKEMEEPGEARFRRLAVRSDQRITVMEDQLGSLRSNNISMEMYVMKKSLLLDMIETSLGQGQDHFVRDAIMKNISKLHVYGYKHEGYVGHINTVQSYYRHSMELLNPSIWQELFLKEQYPIYTKSKDEPPAKYMDTADVSNSLIANGCIIEGQVKNSILSRGVHVKKGAVVKNSILLQGCVISPGGKVENSILDKDVHIQRNKVLMGDYSAPYIASKNRVI